ncbi:hypothetical protein AHF37_12539 [Paragonimus kellicotti]|nr:hypothetical protein AHF37_12539 [Paragonimus kellicotti]
MAYRCIEYKRRRSKNRGLRRTFYSTSLLRPIHCIKDSQSIACRCRVLAAAEALDIQLNCALFYPRKHFLRILPSQ